MNINPNIHVVREAQPAAAIATPIKPATSKRSLLHDLPRSDEVAASFRPEVRWRIGRLVRTRGGRVVWGMILEAIDAGFVTPNRIALWKPSLRLLFPNAPTGKRSFFTRYDLANPRHRDFVMNVVWPIALANKEAVAADPARLEQLVADRPKVEQPKPETRPAVRRVPSNAPAIVLFGQTFWPRGDVLDYSYDECRAAARFFRDLLHLCDASTALSGPKSKAMGIRASTRAIQRFGNRNVLMLVDAIANAMEANPDGICEWPHRPVDGNW
jgi:hypothetical protein